MSEESVSEELKADLKHIVDLAESVPERYRDRCFELLLISALDGTTLAVFEESIIEPETVALIKEFERRLDDTPTITFQEWRRDLNRTLQGIVSAAGRTIDPKSQPKTYRVQKVRSILSPAWARLVLGLPPRW